MSITRKDLLAALVGGAIVMVLAGGVAWAAIPAVPGGVIQGCYDSGGNVKVVETLPCPSKQTPFQWNQRGEPGQPGQPGVAGQPGTPGTNGTSGGDGTSVTSESEPAGANCAEGGSKFTAKNGVTYACNGVKGDPGDPASGTGGLTGREVVTATGVGVCTQIVQFTGFCKAYGGAAATATCPAGKVSTGGATTVESGSGGALFGEGTSAPTANGWFGTAPGISVTTPGTGSPSRVTVFVVCFDAG